MSESEPALTELSDSKSEITAKASKKKISGSEVKTDTQVSVGAESVEHAIPQLQQSRPANPSILQHILLLMLNNWRSLSICSRITTFILPYIFMLLLLGLSFLARSPSYNRPNQSVSRSFNTPADLSSHTSIQALHVYPDTNFTRKFSQGMLTVWDSARKTDRHPLQFIFYSTMKALVNKLNKAEIELAIQLPKDWDGTGAFDYKIIPSPRMNLPDGKENAEMCWKDESACASSQTYLTSGLLAIQRSVALTALGWKGSSERSANSPHGKFDVRIRQMEGRRLHEYGDLAALVYLVAIILSIVPFVELFQKLLVLAVQEKAGVKNLLKMMGISETAYWLSKLLYHGVLVLYYAVVITVSLQIILFRKTNGSVFFVLLLLFGISCLALAYLLSAFFPSTKFTFIPYIAIYGLIIFNVVKYVFFEVPFNAIRRGYFLVNIIAALASLFASLLPDRAYDSWSQRFRDLPLDWGNVKPHGDPNTTQPRFSRDLNEDRVFYGIMFFLIDAIIYFLLGFYLNNVIPDKLGIRQSPIFLCLPSYWGLSKRAKGNVIAASSSSTMADENFEPVPHGMFGAPAISIRNLRKNYTCCPWGKRSPDALKGISMDIYAGQVTAILGKNGAGKSTLFHILIGIIPPTSGTTNIFGFDSSNPADLVKIRRMVGVCLQHEVHFDFLTVLEHLQFFGKLRGCQGIQLHQEVGQLIRDLNLEAVKNNPANKLSGGQKRRLSVGLAFIGNPPIIFLDEPSAGLDPVARRDLWSLLQSRREGKVILLTTHFMDEADILADRKAIMNDGVVQCMGSSLFLKNRFGAGYILAIELTSAAVETTAIDQIIANYAPYASSSRRQIALALKYTFPFSEASNFSTIFAQLELEIGKSIKNLGISTTSLEDVFLKVCGSGGNQQIVSATGVEEQSNVDEQVDVLGDLGVLKINFFSSLWAMIVIRVLRIFRSPFYFIVLYIVPLVLTILILLAIYLPASPRSKVQSRPSSRISDHKGIYKVAIHDDGDDAVGIAHFLQSQGISVKKYAGAPADWRKLSEPGEYMGALSVQMSRTSGNEGLTGDVWLNDGVPHTAPILLDLLFKFYAQTVEDGPGRSVQVNTEYDSLSRQSQFRRKATDTDNFATFLIPLVVGLTYSAPLAELVYDNEKVLRTHLRVNGLSPLIYYLSAFVVYFCLTFTLWLLLTASTWIFNVLPLTDPHSFVILFGLTTLNIIESMLLVFLLSLLMRKAKIVHALFFPLYLILVVEPFGEFVVRKNVPGYHPQRYYYPFCLLNTFFIPFGFYNGVENAWESFTNDPVTFGDYSVYQVIGALFFIIFHIILYLGLLILIHLGSVRKAFFQFCSRSRSAGPQMNSQQLDEDVMAEGQLIAEIFPSVGTNSNCVLIAKELRKSYGRTQILHGLSLLVEKGQVLGLLGHNGAGKTTTMRIITAEELADSGEVKLGGYQVPEQSGLAFRELGFCPQHDALWEDITVSEHMNLYSAINGVPASCRKMLAFRIIDGLSVREHAHKYSQRLSGGTKRKLSYAIAMASAPQIVLMDEPSTGMDPQSKRFLWNTVLGSFRENRGAVLTTHAMEEADVLSSKIAIMAKGALLCVGSPQHLKSKFGRSYTLEIKLESFVEASNNVEGAESSAPSQFDFVFQHFPNCNLAEKFGNRAVFSIPIESSRPLSETFALLEKLKDSNGIEEYAYTQTSLEQVYLTIDQAARNVNG